MSRMRGLAGRERADFPGRRGAGGRRSRPGGAS
jgi:hypothetical protein